MDGGLLVQSRDRNDAESDFRQLRVVTQRKPTAQELLDLRLGWVVCKHVKSNAIVLAKGEMVVGVGAGQMSRVDSVHLAGRKAGERSKGAVLASDAFFPFRDNVDEAARMGVTAIVQPGGSMRDADSIQACDEQRFKDAGRTAAGQKPSMGQDMEKGRRTEIEFLNGLIVREGEKVGLSCHANAVLTDLVKRVEKGELKPDPRHITELRMN